MTYFQVVHLIYGSNNVNTKQWVATTAKDVLRLLRLDNTAFFDIEQGDENACDFLLIYKQSFPLYYREPFLRFWPYGKNLKEIKSQYAPAPYSKSHCSRSMFAKLCYILLKQYAFYNMVLLSIFDLENSSRLLMVQDHIVEAKISKQRREHVKLFNFKTKSLIATCGFSMKI